MLRSRLQLRSNHGLSGAKSGVGGGIVAVVPGKGAIAVFAPPLDEAGHSVKALKVIQLVANRLDFNLFLPRSVGLKS
jgi:glutaminase